MKQLENRLGYHFKQPKLLLAAMIHSSYANENKGKGLQSNERLEFLGDSVLGMIIAEHLYCTYKKMPEGELTRMRAALVCEQSLYEMASELNLGQFLKLGKGEETCGGRSRPSILADAVEAVLAAVYLDGGKDKAEGIVKKFILSKVGPDGEKPERDCKTSLQELVQKEQGNVLSYILVKESGPDHEKEFTVEVRLNGSAIGSGRGRSKKEAEQAAAKMAIAELTK